MAWATGRRTVAFEIHTGRVAPLSGVSRQSGSDDHMPEERGEKSNHNNPKDKTPRVSRTEAVSSWEVSRSGSLMRNYSVARQLAKLIRH